MTKTETMTMDIGKRYVVTKPSDDGTFEVGDHIYMTSDGAISCIEAQGWIDACDVPEAIRGMDIEIDVEWIKRQKKKLLDALANIEVDGV